MPSLPVLSKGGIEVMLVNRQAGILDSLPRWNEVLELPTYHSSNTSQMVLGQYLPLTIDLLCTPAVIILVGDTQDDVERDFNAIREMELNGFFAYKRKATETEIQNYMGSPLMQAKLSVFQSPRAYTPQSGAMAGAFNILKGSPMLLRKLSTSVVSLDGGGSVCTSVTSVISSDTENWLHEPNFELK